MRGAGKVKHRGPFWKFYCYKVNKVLISETNLLIKFVYGHTMLKTPVLVRSLKLSNIGPR